MPQTTPDARHVDAPPPPYTVPGAAPGGRSPCSLFSSQLSGLRSLIQQEQASRSLARHRQDLETLSLLVPRVEALLCSIATVSPPPALVEATLVPEEAVDQGWTLSDSERRRSGHVTTLIRVPRRDVVMMDGDEERRPPGAPDGPGAARENSGLDGHHPEKSGAGAGAGAGSDSWSWWSDEAMARRLAKHLQPSRATASASDDGQVERGKEAKKTARWSLFRRGDSSAEASTPIPSSSSQCHAPSDHIGMTVNAEESTFRRENDMGIWESKTGWSLVVRVCIPLNCRFNNSETPGPWP
ncbi:hypothetical protein EsDP_00002896 [Epichloe bromicola]|uniref:Uncharacterized protein n=1 Tax=Epichloe bromicola TaxID=79588 RepID=A0ABQ0CM63_9HYPO